MENCTKRGAVSNTTSKDYLVLCHYFSICMSAVFWGVYEISCFPANSVIPGGNDITHHLCAHTRAHKSPEYPVLPSVFCQRDCVPCCVTSPLCASSLSGHVI